MLRVVVDTNVLISALIKPDGSPGMILRLLQRGKYRLLYSPTTLKELENVLQRPYFRKYIQEADVALFLTAVQVRGAKIVPTKKLDVVRDVKDNPFLELALAGEADILITGDKDLLVLNPFQGITIIPPSDFLARFVDL